jgi:hypothetical protein
MVELQPQFWFPKIYSNTPNPHSLAVVKAVNQVVELFTSESTSFCDEGKNQGILSSSSLEAKVVLKDILRFLKPEAKPPFYVFGTVTKNDAVVLSWNGLGLNLFDLPWGRLPKIFRYIPVLSLPDMLKAVIHKRYEYDNTYVQDAIDDIKWAKCHEWIRKIQRCFGHGNRDDMQFYDIDSAKSDIQKNIIKKNDDAQKQPPCSSECHVNNALENACKNISTKDKFKQLRKVANLDCQTYRLAPLQGIPSDMISQYKRIVILEDYKKMEELIEEIIKKHDRGVTVQKANAKESIKKWRLCADDGTEILEDKNYDEWETLVCFDLELSEDEETDSLPDGLRILYNTALQHPFVSRLVITGYRTQDERSLNAGTCGFLLKPFTNEELNIAVEKSNPFSTLWLCPKTVRENWKHWVSKVDNKADYNWIRNRLASWLGKYHIGLDAIAKYDKITITKHSVIVMDYYSIKLNYDLNKNQAHNQREMHTLNKLVNDYLKIRSSNPSANIIIILPMTDDIFQPSGALHSVGRIIRDGHDTILHKPMWICSDDPQVESLGQTIKTTLEARPLFDVKYVIYTPIMGLVWPKAKDFLEWQIISPGKKPGKAPDPVDGWSPLGVLMGEIWGFTASFKDILDDPRLGLELSEQLNNERNRHEQRWKTIPAKISSNGLVKEFLSYLLQPGNKVTSYLTIERWLRSVLDEHISRRSSTESLAYLFGGETRYEFGIRGGWYDSKGTYVQDAPLVIEFCGRKAILAREAIERDVVYHLKSLGGEQEVLFQEIPIRGFLK